MKSINPATEEIIADYPEHTPQQIEQILAAAESAFSKWRKVPIGDRALRMKALASLLRRRQTELAKMMTTEVGKTITASESEVEKCAAACDFFAENAATFLSPQMIQSDASKSSIQFDPLGPVLAIMPWNFPLWQVIRFASPALMAGNVSVLKHA